MSYIIPIHWGFDVTIKTLVPTCDFDDEVLCLLGQRQSYVFARPSFVFLLGTRRLLPSFAYSSGGAI